MNTISLEAKTDPNTLVDSVRKEQRPDKFNLLIEYKADVSGPSVLEGWNDVTPLMLCMFSSQQSHPTWMYSGGSCKHWLQTEFSNVSTCVSN